MSPGLAEGRGTCEAGAPSRPGPRPGPRAARALRARGASLSPPTSPGGGRQLQGRPSRRGPSSAEPGTLLPVQTRVGVQTRQAAPGGELPWRTPVWEGACQAPPLSEWLRHIRLLSEPQFPHLCTEALQCMGRGEPGPARGSPRPPCRSDSGPGAPAAGSALTGREPPGPQEDGGRARWTQASPPAWGPGGPSVTPEHGGGGGGAAEEGQ